MATSGNFSSPSTWLGGSVPPANLGANDIVIGGGFTVTLDVNLVLSNSNSLLQLQSTGSIQSTSGNYIVLSSGMLTGDINSSIDVDSVYVGNTNLLYSGTITGDKITFAGPNLPGNITINADEYLYFTAGLTNLPPGTTIALGTSTPRPVIVMDGGTFINSGANFNLTTAYDVRYRQPSVTIGSGDELTGSGLKDIEIAVGTGNIVGLDKDLTVNNLLKLTSGSLALNNGTYKLLMAGNSSFDPGGNGSILGSSTAEIIITSSATNLGTVRFANGGSELKTLDMKAGNSSAELKLGSSVSITGVLNLQSGRVNVQDKTLTIAGGLGSITGGSSNSYIVTEANGQLKQDIGPGASTAYPVGYVTAYAPVVITNNKNLALGGMNVNVQQGVKEQGTSGNDMAATKAVVDASWTTSVQGNPTNLDYKLQLQWGSGMEVNSFDRSRCFVAQYGTKWNNQAGATAGSNGSLHTSEKNNITSGGTFAVLDENTLSVGEIVVNSDMALYPNPAKDVLNITVKKAATATVYNSTGQVILNVEVGKDNNIINISHLAPGMYFIQLNSDGLNSTARFMKG
ncbi:MAG: T9SS type A sorting domain-containing protein [Taibaiella sp.]|nr:T9SS type A sorting domain-containing protein [Taibaiella sp.]